MIDILQQTYYYGFSTTVLDRSNSNCMAVIYYINVICLKQFHEKAIHNKI